jgi:hypothetical protein
LSNRCNNHDPTAISQKGNQLQQDDDDDNDDNDEQQRRQRRRRQRRQLSRRGLVSADRFNDSQLLYQQTGASYLAVNNKHLLTTNQYVQISQQKTARTNHIYLPAMDLTNGLLPRQFPCFPSKQWIRIIVTFLLPLPWVLFPPHATPCENSAPLFCVARVYHIPAAWRNKERNCFSIGIICFSDRKVVV